MFLCDKYFIFAETKRFCGEKKIAGAFIKGKLFITNNMVSMNICHAEIKKLLILQLLLTSGRLRGHLTLV